MTDERIIGFLREAEAGVAVKDLCRKHGFSDASYSLWRSKFGGMSVPGKPNQNACIESFSGRLRDECLNENWFANLLHTRAVIKPWRREHNEGGPKKVFGGLTPAAYAKRMAEIGYPNPGL